MCNFRSFFFFYQDAEKNVTLGYTLANKGILLVRWVLHYVET